MENGIRATLAELVELARMADAMMLAIVDVHGALPAQPEVSMKAIGRAEPPSVHHTAPTVQMTWHDGAEPGMWDILATLEDVIMTSDDWSGLTVQTQLLKMHREVTLKSGRKGIIRFRVMRWV